MNANFKVQRVGSFFFSQHFIESMKNQLRPLMHTEEWLVCKCQLYMNWHRPFALHKAGVISWNSLCWLHLHICCNVCDCANSKTLHPFFIARYLFKGKLLYTLTTIGVATLYPIPTYFNTQNIRHWLPSSNENTWTGRYGRHFAVETKQDILRQISQQFPRTSNQQPQHKLSSTKFCVLHNAPELT